MANQLLARYGVLTRESVAQENLPGGFSAADVTPAALSHLSAAVHSGFVAGYAESIQTVFLIAVPIAVLAFLASWLIPQVELRKWSPGETVPEGEPRDEETLDAVDALEA